MTFENEHMSAFNLNKDLSVLLDKNQPILIVEDSVPDFQAITRVFRKLRIENPVYHCETGRQALDFLFHRGGDYSSDKAPRPGLILLDLNMPETDGREVLKLIKENEELKSIPTVIFTTSESEKDISECYRNGANSYITKPVDLERLLDVISMLRSYWFETVALPQ
jgi:CheY-like chemotaxis protein